MTLRVSFLIVSVVTLWMGLANAAEDHSHHLHEPAVDEHAEHRPAQQDAGTQNEQSDEPSDSERAHVPPEPPQLVMSDMTNKRMIELMQMEDDASFGMLLFDQFEWRATGDEDAQVIDMQAWYGNDHSKLWFKGEGEHVDDEEEGRAELLWDRIISPWWSAQAGVRQDFSHGPSRTWASIGVQGLAPYFFEVEAALYVGEEGRTAARFSGEYDLLITQRLVLQPEIEFEVFGKNDPDNGIGSGFSDLAIGLRLRYEVLREFAPYVGIHWERKFGRTARFARLAGSESSDVMAVIGVRGWF